MQSKVGAGITFKDIEGTDVHILRVYLEYGSRGFVLEAGGRSIFVFDAEQDF